MIVVVAFAFSVAAVTVVHAAKADPKAAPKTSTKPVAKPTTVAPHTVTVVDLQNLAFKVMGSDGKEAAYNFTALTEVIINGKSAKFDDLKKGMTAKVTVSDGNNASRIEAKGGMAPITPTPRKK